MKMVVEDGTRWMTDLYIVSAGDGLVWTPTYVQTP